MSRRDTHDVVGDAVDAITQGQEVQWERCSRLATPDERRVLETLRRLAGLFAGGEAGSAWSTSSAAVGAPDAGGAGHRAVHVLMVLAVIEVAATVLLLPWRWDDYHRAHGDVAVGLLVLLAGHGASAGLLLATGRRDRRTWLLGGYFLFKATLAPPHMLLAFWGHLPSAEVPSVWDLPVSAMVFLHLFSFPLAYAVSPAFLWAFARECPRVHRGTGLDDLARRMVRFSTVIGGAMCAGVALTYLAGTVSDAVDDAVYFAALDATIAMPNVLSLAAVVVVVLRAHTAPTAEVRRVAVFSAGFLIWMGLAAAYDVVQAFSPGFSVSNYQPGSVPALIQPLRFPGMLLLWYSVLAVRVPHPREVVRAGYRRLLTRSGPLVAATAAPVAALAWLLMSSPEQTVGTVVADARAQVLLAATGILLLVLVSRERLLLRLDAWVAPEPADQRHVLAAATARLAQGERLALIRRTVTRTVVRGCGSRAALLMEADVGTAAPDLRGPDQRVAPLPRTSAIVHLLETAGGALRVHPSDPQSVFELLPPEEAAWVLESDADVIVPVPGLGTEVVGVLVVGRRFDDRLVRPVDVPFLEVLATAAGQAVARLRLLEEQGTHRSEPPAALECPVCRCVRAADEGLGCDCGPAYIETEVPRILAGKLRLARRLGVGGMGAVYLARDVRLDREVAVKTLVGASGARSPVLKSEAWAMARVAHPAVAQIHGVESWRGRPFLVVEFLSGGTLADRLRSGAVPAPRAVALAVTLAEALAALHGAGYLHGDVKPSNIGFAAAGSPKLLDFGLARGINDVAATAGGTTRYLSPEVLSGQAYGAADDVWSLCVVLSEMLSGRHPFAGPRAADTVDRIRRQLVDRDAPGVPGSGPPAVAFAASMLTAPCSERPATARAFADALRAMSGTE